MHKTIHQLKQYDINLINKFKERWKTTKGEKYEAVIINLIREGGGEDFIQYGIEFSHDLSKNFLENYQDLRGISLNGESITFPKDDNFEEIDFSYSEFLNSTFNGCHFRAYGSFIKFYNFKFINCDFSNAHFFGCTFEKCSFINADFIQGCLFENCDFINTKFNKYFTPKQLFKDCSFSSAVELKELEEKPINNNWENLNLDLKILQDHYISIKEAYNAGGSKEKEWKYYYKSRHAGTRHNSQNLYDKLKQLILYEYTVGYGEDPFRCLIFSCFLVALFAICYMFTGLKIGDSSNFEFRNISDIIYNFGNSLYFSIVTFTTVGYGDITPINVLGKIIAAFEMICGVTLTGTWIAAFFNKLLR